MGLNRNLGNLTEVIKESGGNIGVGVTLPKEKLEVAGLVGNIRIYGRSGIAQNQITSNVYYNGSAWVRDTSAGAVAISLDSNAGSLGFFTTSATSGFPDQRMLITSGGNVFIGPSPSDAGYKLDVNGTGRFSGGILQLEGGAYPAIQVRGSTTGGGGIRFLAYTDNYAEIFGEYESAGNGILIFRTLSSGSVTERMRITSSGNVRIGTSTVGPSENLTISKTLPNFTSQNGGVLGLSNGYYSCKITSYQENYLDLLGLGFETTFAGVSSTRFRIYANGNYQFFGSNISDERAKENINDLDFNATKKVMELKPKSYNMINDPDKIRYGFIAQDVNETMPDLITGSFEDKGFAGLDYNGIIPVLVKAIQEQQEIIKQLTNKIINLENK
jgi:hypothetical protein